MANILVAVSDRDEGELYALALRFAGHTVSIVGELQEASRLADETRPSLILLDGQLLRAIEDEERRSLARRMMDLHIPMMFVIGRGTKLETIPGIDAQPDAYLDQPISPDDLTKKVHQFLMRNTTKNKQR